MFLFSNLCNWLSLCLVSWFLILNFFLLLLLMKKWWVHMKQVFVNKVPTFAMTHYVKWVITFFSFIEFLLVLNTKYILWIWHALVCVVLWCLRFNRTLIIHANVYDQDQGLTRRYENTTLKIKQVIQAT